MTGHTSPSKGSPSRFLAIAASVDTAAQGLSPGKAIPLTAAIPIRNPVKEPGPAETASRSISSSVSAAPRSMDSTMGSRVWL